MIVTPKDCTEIYDHEPTADEIESFRLKAVDELGGEVWGYPSKIASKKLTWTIFAERT